MALTLDQLQKQRDQLVAEIGSESHVTLADGSSASYKPQADIEEALMRIDREIAALQSPQSRQFTIQTNRGL